MSTQKTSAVAIPLSPVDSSQINAIGCDATTKTLAVQFKGWGGKIGATYHYANVTPAQFAAFSKAESKGKWFGANLKDAVQAHPYTRLPDKKA